MLACSAPSTRRPRSTSTGHRLRRPGTGLDPPRPLLFQRRLRLEDRPITEASIRTFLKRAAAATGITDASGQPLQFAPHDLRRIFGTDSVMNGMPPHIAQLICGNKDINTTMATRRSIPRRSSTVTGPSLPAVEPSVPPKSTE
ncbi:tyrosine-type recombinase/integrase [Streptomyces sp. NPDC046862]|uniref:tyrosine-type recombinase/integrase n=1 Tax=Streptomyces sp. NPDC046862 TaxID=3154603 RepID=UPI003452F1E1